MVLNYCIEVMHRSSVVSSKQLLLSTVVSKRVAKEIFLHRTDSKTCTIDDMFMQNEELLCSKL